jgi:hypothetical protein
LFEWGSALVVTAVVVSVTASVVIAVAVAVISGECVFTAGSVVAIACVAAAVARLVTVEVVELLFAAPGQGAVVAVTRVVAVVYVSVKVAGAVVPAAGTDEDPAIKPVRPVIAVGRAVVRGVVKVAVGADWLHSDADGELGGRNARAA